MEKLYFQQLEMEIWSSDSKIEAGNFEYFNSHAYRRHELNRVQRN